jgi:hypothetical protein
MQPRTSLLLIVLAALIVGVFSFVVTSIPSPYLSTNVTHNLQGIAANIFASLVFVICVIVAQQWLLYRDRRNFRRFFGDLADPKASRLIYPEFALSPECEDALQAVDSGTRFSKHLTASPTRRFIDIPHIVSSNDLLALVIFTTGFGRFLPESPQPLPDGLAVRGLEGALPFSFVSFGLTSNEVTDVYLAMDESPLFTIEDPGGSPSILTSKGKFGKDDEHQHGLILRYQPDPDNYPNQYWFICAGVAAVGTPAAAWHLVHNWKKYHKKYGSEDFLITFKTSNNMAGYRIQTDVVDFGRSAMS